MPSDDADNIFKPPYVSFGAFEELVGRLELHGMPRRIDRSVVTGNRSHQAQVMAALRALDFVDEDGVVLPALRSYVDGTAETRRKILQRILQSKYEEAVQLGLGDGATRGALEEAFDVYGLQGSTKRKAITFFLSAAEEAALPLKFLGARRRRSSQARPGAADAHSETIGRTAAANVAVGSQQVQANQEKYIQVLIKKVESTDSPDATLLDRLERLLGLSAADR